LTDQREGGCVDSAKLNDWMQIVGTFAIVASLIFVGLQMKQSQEIAVAGQYQARFESTAETARAYLQSDTALRIWGSAFKAGIPSSKTLSDDFKIWAQEQPAEELAFRYWVARIGLKTHDNQLFQYRNGFISEDSWQSFHRGFMGNLRNPKELSFHRQAYLSDPNSWSTSFQEYVEETLAEIRSDTTQQQR
jgi:hypothetical protein